MRVYLLCVVRTLASPLDLISMARHHDAMMIYKILTAPQWAELQAKGETLGAPVDIADGFVHFSTAEQMRETAAKHFAGQDDLVLAACDDAKMSNDLKWEVSRGGALFPHLYRMLRLSDVVETHPLPLIDGTHQFPSDLT